MARLLHHRSPFVCHSRREFEALLRVCCLFAITILCVAACAQMPCALGHIEQIVPLTYAPIARAAHMQGTVVLLVHFAHDGSVESERVIYGPKLLTYTAEAFIKGLRATASEGSRECPFAIRYEIHGPPDAECGSAAAEKNAKLPSGPSQADRQHFLMVAAMTCNVTMYSLTAATRAATADFLRNDKQKMQVAVALNQ
jgi:hypothetical protein